MDALAGPAASGLAGPAELAAVGWFLVAWVGYTWLADHSRWAGRTITAAMMRHRRAWMREMLERDQRIVDTQVAGNLITGVSFFASTTIVVVGGLLALLGAQAEAAAALGALPGARPLTPEGWAARMILLLLVFIYAFFKLAWAFRLSSYASILIGAAPRTREDATADERRAAEAHAERTALVIARVAFHVNRGLRAYFFALAALAWFVHPWLFMAATTAVLGVLYRREFRSRALAAVRDEPHAPTM